MHRSRDSSELPATPDDESSAAAHVEQLLAELNVLAVSDADESAFFSQLLSTAVNGLAAVAAAVWQANDQGVLRLAHQLSLAETDLAENRNHQRRHGQLLEAVLRSGVPQWVPARAAVAAAYESPAELPINPTDYLLLLAPVTTEGAAVLILEVFQREDHSSAARPGFLKFVATLAALAETFLARRATVDRELPVEQQPPPSPSAAVVTTRALALASPLIASESQSARGDRFDTFVRAIHASLDPTATAYALANEGRLLIDCDRLCVLRLDDGRPKLLAVSGMDTFDRRANFSRTLEALVQRVAATREPLWYDNQPELSPQLETAVHNYLDAAHCRSLAIIPLFVAEDPAPPPSAAQPDGTLIAALAVECFDAGRFDPGFRQRTQSAADHGALALHNALIYRRVPLMPLWQSLDRLTWLTRARQLPWTVLAGITTLVAIAALAFIPADFDVIAHGQLQPQRRRDVFASADGQVIDVRVAHGQRVGAGEILAELRRPQVDLEFSRVSGEMDTARKRLAAVQAARLSGNDARIDTPQKAQQLTADEQELKATLENLAQQKQLLNGQLAELKLTSPIAGEVLTWNVEQILQARPVQRGQSLLTVADVDGPWVLEVRLDDDRVGPVMAAQQSARQPLSVQYVLATDPGVAHRGTVEKLGRTAETDKAGATWVSATIALDRSDLPNARPGAAAVAKIHCGRRAVGYVWFHELWQAIETRLFW